MDEWVALFDDPILANSALDRFAHRAHQIVMEGPSLRAARAPSPAKGSPRARSKNVALRGSTALAVQPGGLQTGGRAEKDLLSMVRLP